MAWEQGRATVEDLLIKRHLEQVPASLDRAEAMLADARRHVSSALLLADTDPSGGYVLAYHAARKSLAAALETQGLRATSAGGHVALYDAVRAQLDPPLGHLLRPFSRMRQRRNQAEYPSSSSPAVTAEEVRTVQATVEQIIDLAERVLPQLEVFR